MEYAIHNIGTEGQIIFNITADSMFLSDGLRLASFIEGTKHKIPLLKSIKTT